MILLYYPKCSTCIKAKKYLENKNIEFELRDIKIDNPNKEELKKWLELSNEDIKKFFNTSGLVYKELNLKEKLPTMNLEEKLELLSTDGMLIKRPLLITENQVLIGFNEERWSSL